MFNSRWLFCAALISLPAIAGVSLEEKQQRVQELIELSRQLPAASFEGYHRELEYERRGLSLETRASVEANLLADQVRKRVIQAYEAALKNHTNPQAAKQEVRDAIEADIELAAPELKNEILEVAFNTLETIEQGGFSSQEVEIKEVEVVMMKKVMARSNYLNRETLSDPLLPVANPHKDSEKKEYKNKQELLESLTSERDNSRFVSTANISVKTAEIVSTQSDLSLQVKMEFLGAELEAGPSITFKRSLSTDATIMAEGLNPVILRDGNFDHVKRDASNKPIIKNGKVLKRYVAFLCDVDLNFETDYAGSGGFKYMGIGGGVSAASRFSNTVTIASRRISLPESVAGKTVTVKYISELCHKDFVKAKISNHLTVMQSLDLMMKNVVSGLRFSHARTKCAEDRHCADWYNREVISLQKKNNVARCVEHSTEKYKFCQLRGKVGQNCPVYRGGKRVSSGENEYTCDKGLKCVMTDDDDYFVGIKIESATGVCRR
jgi:hypothetical protein